MILSRQSSDTPSTGDDDTLQIRGPGLIVLSIFSMVFITIIMALRLNARLNLVKKTAGIDDVCMVLALPFAYLFSIVTLLDAYRYTRGLHQQDVPLDAWSNALLMWWIQVMAHVACLTFVRVSVLLFYRRLTVTFSRTFLVASWFGIVYAVCGGIAVIGVSLGECQPFDATWMRGNFFWNAEHPDVNCLDEGKLSVVACIYQLIGDLYTAILPMFLLRYITVNRTDKILLAGLFSLGFLVTAACIVRTVVIIRYLYVTGGDIAWDRWIVSVWLTAELYLAMFCACAPALKIYVTYFRKTRPQQSEYGNRQLFSTEGKGVSITTQSTLVDHYAEDTYPRP